MHVSKHLCHCLQVDEAVVADLHRQFYAAVEALFRRYQPSFPGFEDVQLVME